MNDFERLLSDALKKTSDDYRPSDAYAAKQRFLQRLRRRQLFFYSGAVALAGAAAAVAGFLVFARDAAPERAEPLPPAAQLEEAVPDIEVGERPSGVAYGDDSVWVANSGDGTVMVIDPVDRQIVETIDVGGDPDDVAVGVGAAWVSDSGAGTIARVPLPSSGEPLEPFVFEVGDPGSTHMDVAPGADGLWVAKDDFVFRVDPATNDVQAITPTVESPTDIAVGEGAVFVLGESEVARIDPVSLAATPLADVAPSANQDMGFNDGYLWIANGDAGEVTRVDPNTGEKSAPIFVGGNFSGISVDDDAVWVISGGVSEVGVLTRIDPDTLAPIEPRAELVGRPYDITTGAGLVWIANLSAGTVSGLHPDALPGGPDGGPAEEQDTVFVFGADGDIWAARRGDVVPLIQTPDAHESDPTLSPDGRFVAFVRSTSIEPDHIVVRDLRTGEEEGGEPGSSPSFGPDGRLAFVRPTADTGAEIVVVRLAEDPQLFADEIASFEAIVGYSAPNIAQDIAWDLTGEFLYYTAGWEESLLLQAAPDGDPEPFELVPGNSQAGSDYMLPSVRGPSSVHVLRVCCSLEVDDRFEGTELGVISFTEGGPRYESLVRLDLPANLAHFISEGALDSAGNLTMDVNGHDFRWRHTVVRSWFVATSDDILLVNVEGDVVNVTDVLADSGYRFKQIEGLETTPEFDD